ncbi:MAG TPA: hypothetical protein DCW44_02785 [Eubacterium sp.]|nr:hypothetical protein [Eubacterium sp.]
MKLYDAKEIFNMLYEDKIDQEDCIEAVHPEEENHYLFRREWSNNFDQADLLGCLLFKEYKFRIVNQEKAKKIVLEKDKKNRIESLERELKKLKGSEK